MPSNAPAFTIRAAAVGDGRAITELHKRAIRGLAGSHYSDDILRTWAPDRDEAALAAHAARMDEKIRSGQLFFVAESAGRLAGFGELTVAKNELTAIYVDPAFARRGVGRALLVELEKHARQHRLTHLQMDASLNAEAFYRANGFDVQSYGTHRLSNGLPMGCVKMIKHYSPVSPTPSA